MNSRIKFLIKHSLILVFILIVEFVVINNFFKISALNQNLIILIYLILSIPVILLYGIIVGLSKLVFNRYNLRKANKFQARLILSFSTVALIPIIPLMILTNNLINKSLEIWLSKTTESALEIGLNIVSTFLEGKKDQMRLYLNLFEQEKSILPLLSVQPRNTHYKNNLLILANNYKIDFLYLINKDRLNVFDFQRNQNFNNQALQKEIKEELNKRRYIKHIKDNQSEYILGYLPFYDNQKTGNVLGGLYITIPLPKEFTLKANQVAHSLQAYKQMELYKKPIVQGLTTLIVIITTLTVFFIAIIVSYFLSKNIPEPIKVLLDGTKRIAAGDLNFEISYHAKDEIKLLINSFNQMTKELTVSKQALIHSQRLAAWRDIAQRMAHEIRNPLTPIRLTIERLQKKREDNDFKENFEKSTKTILEEVKRLELLIKEFSEFAQIPQLQVEIKNLNHIIMDTLNVFSGMESIQFVSELEKDLPFINVDEKRIREVMINLINNSIEALKEKKDKKITIRTYSKYNIFGKFIYLEIEDNGKGISQQEIDKIFDPYFTTKKEGSGLGLSIVEKIISEHHSKIKCESQIEKGTKFIIEFPC